MTERCVFVQRSLVVAMGRGVRSVGALRLLRRKNAPQSLSTIIRMQNLTKPIATRAARCVLMRRTAAGARDGGCFAFCRCFAAFAAAFLRRYGPNKLPQVVSLAKATHECRHSVRRATKEVQSNPPNPCNNGRAPRKNAALRRLQPLSGAAAF